jgi:ABC-type multidrug transport system fused ATPase/permease subunit
MQAWWRVLRGVRPYKFSVIISLICALGVGLSYASGIVVLLPVMKIFVSKEGITGWAHRTAAESRLNTEFGRFDYNISQNAKGLIITQSRRPAGDPLAQKGNLEITKIEAVVNGESVSAGPDALAADKAADWRDEWRRMVGVLAHADPGSKLTYTLRVIDRSDNNDHVTPNISIDPLPEASFYAVALVAVAERLPADPVKAFEVMVAFFIFLCIVGSIFRYYQQYIGMNVANRVIMDLRRRMYDRVVALPTSLFAQRGTSDVMSRLTNDTGTLTEGVSMAFGKAVQEPIKAAAAFCGAMWIDWRLTLLILGFMPVLGLIIGKFSKHMRKASRRALESSALLLAIINESLIGLRVVKAYSAEGYERRRFARVSKKLYNEQRKLNHYNALSRPTVETLAVIVTSIPMLIVVRWILEEKVKLEDFVTLLALFGAMLEPLRKLSDVNSRVQQSNAAATRVFEVIDMEEEPNRSNALPKLPRHHKSIEFRDLVFSYPGHDEIVLNHVNATVKAGQNVAVVGGNGSGKTTLLQLLPRLYTPTSGKVLIDGVDTATVTLRSLRKQIGLVTQDTVLFADTIYNNIAYGSRHATREQVLDAARRSFADDFIKTLPEGYETRVGEHGVRLSGGQKQRIAIARAILRDPTILILDEAMSQIDADSETKITDALRAFTRNRTTFMIAHRFQSVVSADMIICLDRGNVAGIGTHGQLLETCPPYRKLYENQFRESADAIADEPSDAAVEVP